MAKTVAGLCAIAALSLLSGCASIPPEAPELSTQLGTRIAAVEAAHNRLVEDFFADKRRRVDEYVEEVWVPTFATEFFQEPLIKKTWDQVVSENNPAERLKFIVFVGPKLQAKINAKRLELINPLEDLERTVKSKLKSEYDNMKAMNNSLTAFLQSASKVEENRKRYLEMIGITDKQVDTFINDVDDAFSKIGDATKKIDERKKDADEYKQKIQKVIDKLRKP